MSWEPSDTWRDSYDAWKLATPPEYEGEEDPDRCPCCHNGIVDSATNYHNPGSDVCSNCGGTGSVEDGTELCPPCNVEWADQYRGECDVCGSTGRVRKDVEPERQPLSAIEYYIPPEEEPRF